MNVLDSPEQLRSLQGPLSLAIGVFDGVHLGHQAVLGRALRDAGESSGTAVAVTFDPHPAKILRPDHAPRLLTSTRHKLRLMERFGFSHALVVPFTPELAATPAPEFLNLLHSPAERLSSIVVGCGWRFGRGREGTVDLIRQEGERLGFQAVEIPAVEFDGNPVSSTRIRKAVESGDFETAASCLGRPYSILGTVVSGRQVGRTLGFPTANLRAHNELFPPNGVYAIRAQLDESLLPGVANIGIRPTVESSGERLLEVHLFDFSAEIYGRDLEVHFAAAIRPETKFDSLQALEEQIRRDVATAKSLLS